jgi:hypothetical protein
MATALMDRLDPVDAHHPRQHRRLGPLDLVVEAGIAPHLVAAWLPRADPISGSDDDTPLAAMAVRIDARPAEPIEAPRFVRGAVRGWISSDATKATLLTRTGHARLDLVSRLARVHPGHVTDEAHELMSVAAAFILATGGTALLNASAVADPTGSCWLVLGNEADRTRITHAFCADGGGFVSDNRVIVRWIPLVREQLVVDSWTAPPTSGPCARVLPVRWQPISSLRGVLICAAGDRALRHAWPPASRDAVARAIRRADPLAGADIGECDDRAGLFRLCAARPAFYAPVPRGEPAAARAVLRLSRALEDQIT